MRSTFLELDELAVKRGDRVLLRADLNVPLSDGSVADDFRLRAIVPTIEALRSRGARVVIMSHLGRPDGPDPAFSIRPVAAALAALLGRPITVLPGVVGAEVARAIGTLEPGAVAVLENTRFEPGETRNDPAFAEALASLADAFVEDAFGAVHRAHASTVGVAERLRSAAGPLLAAEVEALGSLLDGPPHPYVVVLGGSKVSDKLGVIRNLLPRVDAMLIGGAMCFTLLKAEGYDVGTSRLEEDRLDDVREILDGPYGDRIRLPSDLVVADRFDSSAERRVVDRGAIPPDWMGLDIGPATVEAFGRLIESAGSVFWNGPMGVFEWEAFRDGTSGVAAAVASSRGHTVVGGGDSVAAVRLLGIEDRIDHVSTGGGAGLELLEGRVLPGLDVLRRWT